ncbi:MAG TPA: hypothetical protein VM287_05250 [Egibacteraceae bacterium]|nr:hypothetical protein [Egibacteraceae bacterium]
MHAPTILVRSLQRARPRGKSGEAWQYHSRSDHHSKVACWGTLFDLLLTSGLLRDHVREGKVVFGVNHPMYDFVNNKRKKLDLVIARPGAEEDPAEGRTVAELGELWGVELSNEERHLLEDLPVGREGSVGSVLVAMEAKACMTEHSKAGPRLYDELNSSHQMVHAASNQALAVGFVMINAATQFVSPDRNRNLPSEAPRAVSTHKQPHAAEVALRAVEQLPRRSDTSARGYDGVGVVVVDLVNDGRTVKLVTDPPAPQPGDIFQYESMLRRVAGEYDSTFRRI